LVVAIAVLATAGCGSGAATSTSTSPTADPPKSAGVLPSSISKQVCSNEAQNQINSALGVTATVSVPTWIDHRYSCRYGYPMGSFTLSVQELSSWPQTYAYYDSFATTMGKSRDLAGLGQAAYQTTGGSMVVRKDWKVLFVDIAALPPQFGVPATSSADVAVTIADIILGCWAGD
jgi:hypothetical protein